MRLLARWLINAVAFLLVAHFVPGFMVTGLVAALIAALVFGFVNSTLGLILRIITFPLTILTFGLFLIVINAIMLRFAASVTPGFMVQNWTAALIGAFLLTIITTFLHWLIKDDRPMDRRLNA
ncbi:MAG TPA: phage holin family protein [Candidatus Angelobacter sp.]|nr:phage holin family protein [Candidatus Angelobacter sp.]